MQKHTKVVVIGGGVVGCSILFHLAKFGWKDCVLLERNELTSGSSWHAAGQIHTISSDPNISRLQGYTINLYRELEELSGQSVGMHSTGGFYLASNQDWYDYLKRERSKARYMGLDQEFISLDELARLHPLVDAKRYRAALWDPLDGDIDPSGVTYAYAKSAQTFGAQYHTHTPVIETVQRPDKTWDVVTEKGTINTEFVINAGGLWAREVGHLAGLNLPVQPMEHHYLLTEDIPEVVEHGERLPAGIDYEGNIYFRQEQMGMLLGTYESSAEPWSVAGTPQNFGHDLLDPCLERIQEKLATGFERIPALQRTGIRKIVNGPFTFGPDGNPMIGPVPGMQNYWVAVGVMAGFCQAGGVGLCLAEWMIDGEPSIDVWAMDIARFGDFASPHYGTLKAKENYERRFTLTFPNETLPAARRQRTTSIHDRLIAKGAVMDANFGLEHALWFADGPEDAFEEPTFLRSRAHGYVAREVKAVRETVGAIEIANFAKHLVSGPAARTFLDSILAGYIPEPGRITLTPLLTPQGRLYGDLTVACLDESRFMLFGSGTFQVALRRYIENRLESSNYDVQYQNVSNHYHGIAFSGPLSRDLLEQICREDVGPENLKFRDIRETFVGGVPAKLLRLSFSGELGYEVYVEPEYQLKLFEEMEAAGTGLGLRWYGARALMSLRLEKGWGVWGLDYRPDFTASESGLDAFINWKKDFIGKEAAFQEYQTGPEKKLVTLSIDSNIDVSNDEAICKDGECVGYITSGGYAHHVKLSMALGYIPTRLARDGESLEVEINGKMVPAQVHVKALYDPGGELLKS